MRRGGPRGSHLLLLLLLLVVVVVLLVILVVSAVMVVLLGCVCVAQANVSAPQRVSALDGTNICQVERPQTIPSTLLPFQPTRCRCIIPCFTRACNQRDAI